MSRSPRNAGSGRAGGGSHPDVVRRVAFTVLRAVDDGDAYANLVLPGLLREHELTGRDAALATELTYGTLRATGTYDAILAECVDRPLGTLDRPVRDVLRLGAHQILATRIPPHAAVATSVDLARAMIGTGPAKLVNAVLRKVTATDLTGWLDRIASPGTGPIPRLSLEHAHPAWITQALCDALWIWTSDVEVDVADDVPALTLDLRPGPVVGMDVHDELGAALAANNEAPAVTLVARPGRSSVDELIGSGATPTPYSSYGAVLGGGDPSGVPAVREQRAGVQDEGSQLVALALAAADLDGPDAEWLDMCAGPGGKAALLAGLAAERGARLTAMEVAPHRAELVEQALGLSGEPGVHNVVVGDARSDVPCPGAYDRVLLDAPCSGLGALRRRPEARWRRKPGDVYDLRELQIQLLTSALHAVRPGGVVAYVTCSPHVAETLTVVAEVMRAFPKVSLVEARPYLPGVPDLGPGPDVQLWPHRHGTDAMYLALLRR